jgi:hypothetical protein
VPATDLATAGAALEADDLAELLCEDRLLGLAEVMNFPGVIAGAPPPRPSTARCWCWPAPAPARPAC